MTKVHLPLPIYAPLLMRVCECMRFFVSVCMFVCVLTYFVYVGTSVVGVCVFVQSVIVPISASV
jgi:hypothetical protein